MNISGRTIDRDKLLKALAYNPEFDIKVAAFFLESNKTAIQMAVESKCKILSGNSQCYTQEQLTDMTIASYNVGADAVIRSINNTSSIGDLRKVFTYDDP